MEPSFLRAGVFRADRNVDFHTHDGVEILLVTGGACRIRTPDSEWLHGQQGDFFVTPKAIPHAQISLKDCETTYTVFAPGSLPFNDRLRVLSLQAKDPLHRWMRDLSALFLDNIAVDPGAIRHLLMACLSHVHYLETQQALTSDYHPAVEKALVFMRDHLRERLSPRELARHTGVSVSHMNLLFRRNLGCSPMRRLEKMRMENAARILSAPYARINEAALDCGYEDVNYFVRVFKKHMDLPPGQWRKRTGQ